MIGVGTADGAYVGSNGLAHGVRVEERLGQPHRLWLFLGGGYCGQDTRGVSRAEMIGCARPLDWAPVRGEFVLAPEDETRFDLPE